MYGWLAAATGSSLKSQMVLKWCFVSLIIVIKFYSYQVFIFKNSVFSANLLQYTCRAFPKIWHNYHTLIDVIDRIFMRNHFSFTENVGNMIKYQPNWMNLHIHNPKACISVTLIVVNWNIFINHLWLIISNI